MKWLPATMACFMLLGACASRPDHYYVLSPNPVQDVAARAAPSAQVTLKVWLPELVDRLEMVVTTSADAVVLLDHERWAARLSDQVPLTLAQNLERRRADLLVSRLDKGNLPTVLVSVDIVHWAVHRAGRASIEAHWRVSNPREGAVTLGSEVFSAPVKRDDYASIAQAFSDCLGLLADRLAAQISSGVAG